MSLSTSVLLESLRRSHIFMLRICLGNMLNQSALITALSAFMLLGKKNISLYLIGLIRLYQDNVVHEFTCLNLMRLGNLKIFSFTGTISTQTFTGLIFTIKF